MSEAAVASSTPARGAVEAGGASVAQRIEALEEMVFSLEQRLFALEQAKEGSEEE